MNDYLVNFGKCYECGQEITNIDDLNFYEDFEKMFEVFCSSCKRSNKIDELVS